MAIKPYASSDIWDVVEYGESRTVASSNLLAIQYDIDTQELQVRFNSGPTYEYYGVTEDLVAKMLAAPSPGQFFYHNIRTAFTYARISDG